MADTLARPGAVPLDTDVEPYAVAQELTSTLLPQQRTQLANIMSIDCERLARAGIALTEPTATEDRVRYLLAVRRYGPTIANTIAADSVC